MYKKCVKLRLEIKTLNQYVRTTEEYLDALT